jgi:hypothetical protein
VNPYLKFQLHQLDVAIGLRARMDLRMSSFSAFEEIGTPFIGKDGEG